jgi:superfamily I DNA/RNA helicase
VRDALRLTYSHLFMDEFQDTTQVQYDLAKTIFCGPTSTRESVVCMARPGRRCQPP